MCLTCKALTDENRVSIISTLKALSSTGRFALMVDFLSKAERDEVSI